MCPDLKSRFPPPDQPIRIARRHSKEAIGFDDQSGYTKPEDPGIVYSETVPAGTDISVDILFAGNAASFDPELLIVKAGSEVLTGCICSDKTVTCKLPSNCSDGCTAFR